MRKPFHLQRPRIARAGIVIVSLLLLVIATMSESTPAAAQTQPDVSTWRSYAVPEHGLTLKAPADWIRNEDFAEGSRDIFSLSVPDLPPESAAGCGILANRTKSGAAVNIESYIEKMNEERLLKALSREFTNLYLHEMEVADLSGRKALRTTFSGDRKSGRWTYMNFDMAESDNFYRLQCFFRPTTVNEYYLTFMAIAQSVVIESR